ncbi:hypothetical protein [Paraburkholderia sediminicola]|uniref:hypothetical protein n=1 Tax=Paraburkholderia sediminicola TaxID=458836 RepID=UPI0038BAFC43
MANCSLRHIFLRISIRISEKLMAWIGVTTLVFLLNLHAASGQEFTRKLVPPLSVEMESIPYGRHIKMDFLIKNENPYDIDLSLIYRTSAELKELYALKSDQKDKWESKSSPPKFPLISSSLLIKKKDSSFYLATDTQISRLVAHGWRDSEHGSLSLRIGTVTLSPGEYTLELSSYDPPPILSKLHWAIEITHPGH